LFLGVNIYFLGVNIWFVGVTNLFPRGDNAKLVFDSENKVTVVEFLSGYDSASACVKGTTSLNLGAALTLDSMDNL